MADSKFLLTLTLTKQGKVKGSSTGKEGHLDWSKGLECHGFNFVSVAQIDPNSGAPTGKRRHNPITIRREVDAASPLLLQALCTNEGFKTAILEFVRPSGKAAMYKIIELSNGGILKITPAWAGGKKCEDVTLSYEGIVVNGVPDGIVVDFH
jgi:type VI secretion system secreted protein Hcp